MTMTIDLKAEVQAELARQAASQVVDVGAYAASLLEKAIDAPNDRKTLRHCKSWRSFRIDSHCFPTKLFHERVYIGTTIETGG